MMNEKWFADAEELEFYITLIEENRAVMLQTARSMLSGKLSGYAEDAVQDACFSIARNIYLIKSRVECSKRRAFCVRVVKNKAIDIARREKNTTQSYDEIDYEIPANILDPLDEFLETEAYDNLLAVINRLDESYKTVLKYKLIDGLGDDEIASLLGITPKNVNVRTFRAKKKLRTLLKGAKEDDGRRGYSYTSLDTG